MVAKLSAMSVGMIEARANAARRRQRCQLLANIVIVIGYILGGALFYHHAEGWTFADSAYFCVVTMSTVGFGDMNATMSHTKLFTALYILIGVTLVYARKRCAQQTPASRGGTTLVLPAKRCASRCA